MRNTVDEPTWDVLKHGYLESILKKGEGPTKEFIGTKFLSGLDDDILKATFKPEEIASIKALANAAELLQRPASGFAATGKLVVAIGQAGVLTDIVSGQGFLTRPGQAAILLSPVALARIATNKVWSKLLIQGMKDPVRFSGSLARLTRRASCIDIENAMRQRQEKLEIAQRVELSRAKLAKQAILKIR